MGAEGTFSRRTLSELEMYSPNIRDRNSSQTPVVTQALIGLDVLGRKLLAKHLLRPDFCTSTHPKGLLLQWRQ